MSHPSFFFALSASRPVSLLVPLSISLLFIMAACGDDSDEQTDANQSSADRVMCDSDELSASAACEAAGCLYRSGTALDPDSCAVLSMSTGSCTEPNSDFIEGPVLGVRGQVVYLFEEGAPLGIQLCSEDSGLAGCSCPVN